MEGFANTYIVDTNVFKRLASEAGENITYCTTLYSYSTYNICDGWFCTRNVNCESGCCSSDSTCGCSDLAWLWWLLGFLFLFCCISSMIA